MTFSLWSLLCQTEAYRASNLALRTYPGEERNIMYFSSKSYPTTQKPGANLPSFRMIPLVLYLCPVHHLQRRIIYVALFCKDSQEALSQIKPDIDKSFLKGVSRALITFLLSIQFVSIHTIYAIMSLLHLLILELKSKTFATPPTSTNSPSPLLAIPAPRSILHNQPKVSKIRHHARIKWQLQ